MQNQIFAAALGLAAPWFVQGVEGIGILKGLFAWAGKYQRPR